MQDIDNMKIGQDHTHMVDHSGVRYEFVGEQLHHVLHYVHSGHVDHHLGVLAVMWRVKQINILSANTICFVL